MNRRGKKKEVWMMMPHVAINIFLNEMKKEIRTYLNMQTILITLSQKKGLVGQETDVKESKEWRREGDSKTHTPFGHVHVSIQRKPS
jgi:hypothetical protein